MAPRARIALRVVQLAVVAVVVVVALRSLRGQWSAVGASVRAVRLDGPLALLASAIVLATYALLVDAWRRVANGMGGRLTWGVAARIWFVSNLARYAGSLFQIGALGVLSRREGLSPVTAAGAAVLMTGVNLVTGFAVAFGAGAGAAQLGAKGVVVAAMGALGVALAPAITPRLARLASRVTGRDVALPPVSARALVVAALGTTAAWMLYGVAFRLLTLATLGHAPGGWLTYVWVYTLAYLVGFLGLTPAGIGVAEGAMTIAFAAAGILTAPEAITMAAVSRVWRTVLEILPGLAFVAVRAGRGVPSTERSDS